jgi:hypothetical protein
MARQQRSTTFAQESTHSIIRVSQINAEMKIGKGTAQRALAGLPKIEA